jgi:hypothetical protein
MPADVLREATTGGCDPVILAEKRSDRDFFEIGDMTIGDRRSPEGTRG